MKSAFSHVDLVEDKWTIPLPDIGRDGIMLGHDKGVSDHKQAPRGQSDKLSEGLAEIGFF